MQAFLERFYEEVDRNLGDPHASARYPKSAKLADIRVPPEGYRSGVPPGLCRGNRHAEGRCGVL